MMVHDAETIGRLAVLERQWSLRLCELGSANIAAGNKGRSGGGIKGVKVNENITDSILGRSCQRHIRWECLRDGPEDGPRSDDQQSEEAQCQRELTRKEPDSDRHQGHDQQSA